MSHETPIIQRIRIRFGKSHALKYTSNLDLAKIWERVLRRAQLPILYTEGFNTRPRLQLACPLPLGISSEYEIIDLALNEALDYQAEQLITALKEVSPAGLDIYEIYDVDPRAPTLQSLARSAEYNLTFVDGLSISYLEQKVNHILNSETLMIEKMRKHKGRKQLTKFDIRPLILNLKPTRPDQLWAHLAVGDQGNLRPEALLPLLDLEEAFVNIHRLFIHFES